MSPKSIVPLKPWDKFSVSAGFTTRNFSVLLKKTEEISEIFNQEKLRTAWKNDGYIFLNQVHGGEIAVIEKGKTPQNGEFLRVPETDGVLTDASGCALLVLTADCLSIFFCAMKDKKASWIGLVHAGWRGTKETIAQKAFILLMKKARCPAQDIHIAFGPSIGAGSYEVGEEFQENFPAESLRRIKGKLFFDLAGENKRQLVEAGADPKNISDVKIDTFSDKNFYSFRREKENAGRMISFIFKR